MTAPERPATRESVVDPTISIYAGELRPFVVLKDKTSTCFLRRMSAHEAGKQSHQQYDGGVCASDRSLKEDVHGTIAMYHK